MAPPNNETLNETRNLLTEIQGQIADIETGYKKVSGAQKHGLHNYEKILTSILKGNTKDVANMKKRKDLIKELVDGNISLENIQSRRMKILKKMNDGRSKGHKKSQEGYNLDLKMLDVAESKLKQDELTAASIGAADDLTGGMVSKAKEFVATMKANPLIALLGVAVILLKSFSDNLDKIGEKFGAIGVKTFSQDLMTADAEMIKLGYETGIAGDMAAKMSSEFGVGFKEAIKLAPKIANLSKGLGLSTDEGVALVGQMREITNLSTEESLQLARQTELLAKQNGVAPGAVMRDIAQSSEVMAKFTFDGGKNILRAAVQAKKLGTNLSTVAGVMDNMLDFQSSIEAEMNASIMIGRQLNFQKARELALNNDIEGAMTEIVSQLGSEEEFNKLNALQRKALAASIGVGVDQLAKFVGKEKESVTLAGKLADQKGFEELVGPEALSNMSEMIGSLKSVAAVLVQTLGPALNLIVGMFSGLLTFVDKFIGVGPALLGLLVAIKGKAIATAASQMVSAVSGFFQAASLGSISTMGFGTPVMIGMALAAAGAMYKMVSKAQSIGDMISPATGKTMVSTKEGGLFELSKNDDLMAGPGIASNGGTSSPTVNINNAEIEKKLDTLISNMESYFGFGGTAVKGIGKSVVGGIEAAI
jgi:hypothetical protein